MASDDIVVRFERVQKSYDGRTMAVRELTLDVRRGEFLTFLGPSGSGKTTCLLMLAGFEMPTAGDILLQGRPVTNLPPHRRDIGMVFQNYALFPHLTVAENVAFPLSVRGRPRGEIEERVARAIDMVKLPGLGGRRPAQLSGGQQQRVALARALVYEPKLILLDEPLGALDKQLREEMQYELKRLHQAVGITMIYVTHDQSEAMTMSDRIAVFDQGEVRQLADPRTLYEQPANAFVAGFVGENNRLAGIAEAAADGRCRLRLPDGRIVAGMAAAPIAAGAAAILSIRPERLQVGDHAASCDTRFSARVEDLSYLGDHLRLHLVGPGGEALVAKLSHAGGGMSLEPGDTTALGWSAADARVFASE